MNLAGLDVSIIGPALAAGLVVLSTHIPLGREVLRRGIIFIDLAIAQIAGLGVIIAYSIGLDEHGIAAQIAAVICALAGAWLLNWLDKKIGRHQEAMIGVSFILAATAGILLLAHNPHAGQHLREMLVGQILWVHWSQVIYAAVVSLIILLIWSRYRQMTGSFGFYTLFAVAVTVSVQLVGIYLVFASLIIPALAASFCVTDNRHQIVAVMVGVSGYILGLIISAVFDLPAGAVIVWMIALSALSAIAINALQRGRGKR